MQPPTDGCVDIDSGRLRFESQRHAREDEAAERVIPGGIGVGVVRPIARRAIADDQRRLAIEKIVDAQSKFDAGPKAEHRGNVEIILRAQLRVSRNDLVRQVELWIERGKFHTPGVSPLE